MANRLNVITVDGNIGSGKSTFLEALKAYGNDRIVVVPEPLDIWQQLGALEKLYTDPKRWAYSFLLLAAKSRMDIFNQLLKENEYDKVYVLERTIETDFRVFANVLHEYGHITDFERKLFQHMMDDNLYDYEYNVYECKKIYIRCSPTKCQERIKRRNRTEESGIEEAYMECLHRYHEKWLNDGDNLLIIDADEDFEYDRDRIESILSKIVMLSFMETNY